MSDATCEPSYGPDQMSGQEPDWKGLALFLAGCLASTLDNEACLARTSKSSNKRWREIGHSTLEAIAGKPLARQTPEPEDVMDRLKKAILRADPHQRGGKGEL